MRGEGACPCMHRAVAGGVHERALCGWHIRFVEDFGDGREEAVELHLLLERLHGHAHLSRHSCVWQGRAWPDGDHSGITSERSRFRVSMEHTKHPDLKHRPQGLESQQTACQQRKNRIGRRRCREASMQGMGVDFAGGVRQETREARDHTFHAEPHEERRRERRGATAHWAKARLSAVYCAVLCSGFGKRTIDAARRGAKLISMETCTSDHLLLRRQIITKSQPRSSPHYQRADRGLHTHLYLVAVYTRRALSLSRPRAAAGAALTDRAREGRPLVRWCAVDWEATHTREGPT